MEEKKVFTVEFTNNQAIFSATPNVTPEMLAELIVCLGYAYSGKHYVTMFDKNGHEDSEKRFDKEFTRLVNDVLASFYSQKAKELNVPAISAMQGLEHVTKITRIFPK